MTRIHLSAPGTWMSLQGLICYSWEIHGYCLVSLLTRLMANWKDPNTSMSWGNMLTTYWSKVAWNLTARTHWHQCYMLPLTELALQRLKPSYIHRFIGLLILLLSPNPYICQCITPRYFLNPCMYIKPHSKNTLTPMLHAATDRTTIAEAKAIIHP